MRIVLNTALFAKALSEISLVVPQKTPLQILQYAKFTVSGGRLKIEANSQQSYIVKSIGISTYDADGGFLAKCDELFSLVSKLKDETISLFLDDDTLIIEYALGKAKIHTLPTNEFPVMEIVNEDVTELSMPTAFLAESIKTAKRFVASDDYREVLKTIYAFVDNGTFGYCATDTRLLITNTYNDSRIVGTNQNWFIEPFVFTPLMKACESADIANIKVSTKQVSYQIGDTLIISTQTQALFPDFKRIIPQTHTIECMTEKDKLKDMLSRAALMSDETRCVKIHIDNTDITLSSDNIQIGKQLSETTRHKGCNGEITIGMHILYMLTCLDVCNTNDIAIRITDNTHPVVFYDETMPNKKVIAMPLIIN